MTNNMIYEDDILDYIRNVKPNLSDVSLKWELHHFIKMNNLKHIGKKKYIMDGRIYSYNYQSDLTQSIDEFLSNKFPELKIVIWENKQLNEWLNLLITKNLIYIEVEKEYVEYVFSSLNESYGSNHLILLNPNREMINNYLRNDLIIVKTLFSKSPINKNNHKIMLEKMVVDLLSNDFKLDTRAIEDVILGIKRTYDINLDKALSYANRRRIKKKLLEQWGTN